jgi:hypothetical protein
MPFDHDIDAVLDWNTPSSSSALYSYMAMKEERIKE